MIYRASSSTSRSRSKSETVPLSGVLACGCDVDLREPEISKPTPKWWCCGAFQKRKAA